MSEIRWQGVFAVLVSPFHDDQSLDLDGLTRQVEFCLACGVDGVVAPVIAGEFFTLSDAERLAVIERVVNALDGRCPFVAGVAGTSAPHAAELARAATDLGADALIAMPPYVTPCRREDVLAYYQTLAEASPLPLVVQNAPSPFGSPLATDDLVSLLERHATIQVIKEETAPNPQKLGTIVNAAGGKVKGVFGGLGGIYLFNELSRGATGTMPACQFADVMVDIVHYYQQGEMCEARQRFSALQPLLVMEGLYKMTFMKRCLVRRGVIDSAVTRVSEPALDKYDELELDALWETLEPFFRVPTP